MPRFEARNPIPLKDPAGITDSEMLAHSESVDRWLGFRIPEIERALNLKGCLYKPSNHDGTLQRLWFGLAEQILLTPYIELRWILAQLQLPDRAMVVDLGAGYGRLGHVLARNYPGAKFVGYEYVGERVAEARRLFAKEKLNGCEMIHADLSRKTFQPVEADAYFLYDFGTPEAIEKTLFDLRKISERRSFTLVARGRTCRYAIELRHPWLKRISSITGEGRTSTYLTELNRPLDLAP
jgi:SAM-dependent methyltransferase